MNAINRNILSVIELCRKLLLCADSGDIERKDDSCGVLFGTTRDCAFKMLDLAIKERELHIRKGIWNDSEAAGRSEKKPAAESGSVL